MTKGRDVSEMLHEPTLVLNRHWVPISVTTVQHAIVLIYADRAHVLCPHTYKPHDFAAWQSRGVVNGAGRIHGVGFDLEAPEVVVLGRYQKIPPRGVTFNRRNLARRDGHLCQYCGNHEDLTIDHVIPVSRGGATNWDNCVLACRRCNGRKGNQTPREAGMKLQRRPVEPSWDPHYLFGHHSTRPQSWNNFLGQSAQTRA